MALTQINLPVLSYCEIPQELTEDDAISHNQPDSYVIHPVTSKEEQEKYTDNFEITNWIIENYPELEGKDVLIHIDY